MTFEFGRNSMKHLHTVHYDLQWVARESLAVGLMDFSVICGYRNEIDQNKAFQNGKSKLKYPESKHNKIPAMAFDAVPYINEAISWNMMHCCCLAFMILTVAKKLGIKIRWGGNWDLDFEPITDQHFNDLAHFELI